MSTQNSKQRNQKIVLELASLPGNNICADCKARLPRWTSYNLGIFICVNCASIHRKIGTHITKVKSLTMDDWTKEQVETMRSMGNVKSNAIYNPNEIRNPPPPNLEETERDSEIEQYIRGKYQYKKFADKAALVALKLGPSRSASAPSAPLPPPTTAPRSGSQVTKPHVAASTPPTSSYTAPPKLPQVSSTTQPPQPSGGVWHDIKSLKDNGQNSSLPLQYQQPTYSQTSHPMQLPTVNSASSYPVGVSPSASLGFNTYQVRTNPFSQEKSQPFPVSSMPSPFSTPSMNSQPFGPQSLPATPSYFHPQPQAAMQIQNPSPGQGFLSPSPSQLFPSAPTGQQPSFLSQSQSSIQQPYISHSHSPQLMQSSSTPPQFMYPNPAPAQPQMNVPTHGQFSGMTTMQMQQQAVQLQQQMQMQQHQQQQMRQQHQQLGQNYFSSTQLQSQPQMMLGQVNSVYGQTPLYQGSFPSQTGGQWSTR